ncbi:MAG: hypothetical protein HYY20_09405 [Candidatus Tectomicrobia bacterium]|uniref:Uncharacterized protein n=1 Tax=Tectimicrobiota bacterium TaxID=2528274 RepID=A0A932CPH5_UNCTE|nr:hypothetical protein [Candidatus Tectomicrobia bacterium]
MISSVQVHLLLNHILIVGLGIALLLLLLAEVRRGSGLAQAGWIVLITAAAFAVPTYLTGEAAEEAIKHLPGVAEELIETHEDRALIALILFLPLPKLK